MKHLQIDAYLWQKSRKLRHMSKQKTEHVAKIAFVFILRQKEIENKKLRTKNKHIILCYTNVVCWCKDFTSDTI